MAATGGKKFADSPCACPTHTASTKRTAAVPYLSLKVHMYCLHVMGAKTANSGVHRAAVA